MSSSKYGGFSHEELAALGPWSLPQISENTDFEDDNDVVDTGREQKSATPVLTVDEIEAMQKQAYEEAFAQGQRDGYQFGLEQGRRQGIEQAQAEHGKLLQQKTAAFSDLMEALSEPFKNLDEEVEHELVKLAITIATQIIRREIKIDPGQVIAAVREAIRILPLSSQKISLYLHPDDAEVIRSSLSIDESASSWAVVEDPLITRGGCKIDTDVSHIDATVENRLAAVVANLFGGEREQDKAKK
jgi:flagellar assembly protein FliH